MNRKLRAILFNIFRSFVFGILLMCVFTVGYLAFKHSWWLTLVIAFSLGTLTSLFFMWLANGKPRK